MAAAAHSLHRWVVRRRGLPAADLEAAAGQAEPHAEVPVAAVPEQRQRSHGEQREDRQRRERAVGDQPPDLLDATGGRRRPRRAPGYVASNQRTNARVLPHCAATRSCRAFWSCPGRKTRCPGTGPPHPHAQVTGPVAGTLM